MEVQKIIPKEPEGRRAKSICYIFICNLCNMTCKWAHTPIPTVWAVIDSSMRLTIKLFSALSVRILPPLLCKWSGATEIINWTLAGSAEYYFTCGGGIFISVRRAYTHLLWHKIFGCGSLWNKPLICTLHRWKYWRIIRCIFSSQWNAAHLYTIA